MTASIASLTDMIINSLDDEKVLKDKLQEKQLEHILGLLLENNIITLSELFTLNNKAKIQKIIEQQIDHNRNINVTTTPRDKNEFANIVMDVIQSKVASQQHDHGNKFKFDTFTNTMTTISTSDQPSSFGYTSHPNTQSHPPQPMCPIYDKTPPKPDHVTNYKPPDLHFDIGDFENDTGSIITLDSIPISQVGMGSVTNTPNISNMSATSINTTNKSTTISSTHQLVTIQTPNMDELVNKHSGPNDNGTGAALANTFAEKMNKAIASKINHSTSPPADKTPKKQITTSTTIHPQQELFEEYDAYYNEAEEEGVPLGGMDAPQINLTDENNNTSYNGQYDNTSCMMDAPTPRAWEYAWQQSPREVTQARTPATSPPRIRDPMLIKNALEGVAYYADKLDSLHSEYRRVYSEQQQLYSQQQQLQQLTSDSMDPNEYQSVQHRYKLIEQSYYQMSCTLQSLIIGIYENFTKMKRSLDTKYEFQLDANRRGQFDRFQQYYDQFATTQHHLLQFGQQQWKIKEKQRLQQQQQAKAQTYNYKVPPTPHHYRQMVNNNYKQNDDYKHSHMYQRHTAHMQSMTPRESSNNRMGQINYPWNNNTQYQPHNNYVNYPKTTSAIPDRKFQWNYKQQQQPQQQQPMQRNNVSQTPRGQGNNNSKKTSGDIPNMGYVYIGSRMSQLISHISLSDGEVSSNELRIRNYINDILIEYFKDEFDIITYGSAKHKLFIKDYSDFDFCIRCKKLGTDNAKHLESIKYICNKLSENKSAGVEGVEIIDAIEKSIHGHYLNNISHIRFMDSKSHCSVDLVLNNLPEIGSSRFIDAYESIDPRFALLCRVVKYWSRQRKINEPISGTLSTYALVLMVINFLQLRRVLPTLSIMIFDRETGLSPWSTQDDYQINVQKYRDFASKNEEPHSKLLVNFFYFYSHKFNFDKDVVSVRTGTYLMKSEKKWNKDANKHALCVENPFNSKTNLTENVDKKSLKRINDEFHRAYAILCESYKIYEVCKLAE